MAVNARLAFLFLVVLLQGCIPFRSAFLGIPDKRDINRFKSAEIQAADSCFEFVKLPNAVIKVNDWTSDVPVFKPLDSVFVDHHVRSFVVIQNDSLKYEYYKEKLNENSLHSSYSIAKAFTSALIGIAIQEGYIKSEQEQVVKYVPELKGLPYADSLTIEHLLNHTSGFKYNLAVDAVIYYGRNALNALAKLRFEVPPGTKQRYLNINVELLGIILERATGIGPAKYLEDKIWKPIQMCNNGSWSVDEKNGTAKTFCCLGATALDYAKFGRLYLHGGVWNGKRIISEEWYEKSTARDTANGSSFNYNYCWHIGLKEYGDYMAIGMYKQHIYINPKKNLVIVVMNDGERPLKAERVNWWFIFRQIADEL